ncbi:hypothetical protein M438DRAFT_408653 [Aureobasidium pullulans EXF-150]|uniref:Uncharacterized protein n=1 Tax=Aureobasidium pullulans EXF-150 TaxID=1043002 RepID=A0A074XER5_AURPU|nr:uncharacterized protein M438DRAFT_408653 [Aureobasidium pullulans EXF-150]KEQ80537.1 hypothetical protein M438DRAFT_408653 [Aureobasidium pullulans EXF-150]
MEINQPTSIEDFEEAYITVTQILKDHKLVNKETTQKDMQPAIEEAQKLFKNKQTPAHIRLRVLIFLSATTDDWNVAEGYRLDAEFLCSILHRFPSSHKKGNLEQMLTESRESLEELKVAQEEAKRLADFAEVDDWIEELVEVWDVKEIEADESVTQTVSAVDKERGNDEEDYEIL